MIELHFYKFNNLFAILHHSVLAPISVQLKYLGAHILLVWDLMHIGTDAPHQEILFLYNKENLILVLLFSQFDVFLQLTS